jgi:tetratricopeptide (TPR) repeat protein
MLLKQASNLERFVKEDSALLKYKEVLNVEENNMQALIKSSLLTISIGGRQPDIKVKKDFFERAKVYADKALAIDSNNADANYARGLTAWKLGEVEQENKKIVNLIKEAKVYTEKALAINPNHGKANHLLGKWNFEVLNAAFTKKVALKLYGGLPEAKMENAYKYMEKSRTLEPYFVQNFMDLAKAYKLDNNPTKAIEVLSQLVKLPVRTGDDAGLKAEGKKMLAEMQ